MVNILFPKIFLFKTFWFTTTSFNETIDTIVWFGDYLTIQKTDEIGWTSKKNTVSTRIHAKKR